MHLIEKIRIAELLIGFEGSQTELGYDKQYDQLFCYKLF